jgi:hypothetical protein
MNMNYKITISELNYTDGVLSAVTSVYEQTVENLDIKSVIEAVNNAPVTASPIKQRRAPRSDKGKKRNQEPMPAQA